MASVSVTCNTHVAVVEGHQWWVDIRSSLLSENLSFYANADPHQTFLV